jgi:molybdopterin molybdotransferase
MDYTTCQQAIAQLTPTTELERIPLAAALSRVTARDITSRIPQPEFNQSLRDGFVLAGYVTGSDEYQDFPVTGMIPAGSTNAVHLLDGQACRIMTGGMIPDGGVQVVQQEDCLHLDNMIRVPTEVLQGKPRYIQQQGAGIASGATVINEGTVLLPEHISLLAAVGVEGVEVFRKPRIGFFCTGSELVDSAKDLQPGLKVSSNRYLLEGFILQCGAEPHYLGTVGDSAGEMAKIFQQLTNNVFDIVISTGGMGPGKYDLIEKSFGDAGGHTIYNRLNLRPGKDSLFGTLNRTLFFGLPGPPTAVRALMNALVGPAILKMQGLNIPFPKTLQAHIQHQITVRRHGVMQLWGGVLSFLNGRCEVRAADKTESSSCYILISPETTGYMPGDLVEIHLLSSLHFQLQP